MDPGSGAEIVNAKCTRFKESQLCFSPIEAEGIALDFVIVLVITGYHIVPRWSCTQIVAAY